MWQQSAPVKQCMPFRNKVEERVVYAEKLGNINQVGALPVQARLLLHLEA